MKDLALVLFVCSILSGCESIVDYRGKFLQQSDLNDIKVGVSTLSDIEDKIGESTFNFDDGKSLMYIGLKVSRKAFYLPRIVLTKGYLIKLGNDGKVSGVYEMIMTAPGLICDKNATVIKEENISFWQQIVNNYAKMSSRGGSQGPSQ